MCNIRALHAPRPPAPPPYRSPPRGLSGIECRPVQRVQRPGVCRALHGLPWYLPRPGSDTACAAVCAVQSFRVCWGWGIHRRGIRGAPGVGQVMPAIKFFKEKGVFRCHSRQHPPHPHKTKPIRLCNSPKIPKNTKRPLSLSNLWYT